MKHQNDTDLALAFVKTIFDRMLTFKYVYIAFLIVFIGFAIAYTKYSTKIYELNAVIGPVKNNRSTVLESNDMFRGGNVSTNVGSELDIAMNDLHSFSLVLKTVKNLNLEVGYFMDSNYPIKKYKEIYQQSPFIVNIDKSHLQAVDVRFFVTILNDSTFRLQVIGKTYSLYNYIDSKAIEDKLPFEFDSLCSFNKTIRNPRFQFSLSKNGDLFNNPEIYKELYCFEMYNPEELAKEYLKKVSIEPVSWLASIIQVRFSSANLQKSLAFLNSYVNLFLDENLAKKNQMALNTIKFIDSQISEMSDSLVNAESKLRNFRSENQVMDLSFQGQQIYEQMTQNEASRTNIELQIRYYNYVLNYFKINQDISGINPPSSANVNDPVLNKLITDIISLYSERSTILNKGDKNLFSAQIDNKIKIQKQAIIDNATNNLNTLNITLNELNYKADKLSKDLATLPKKEMNMVNIQRKFNLNNTIYTYLLQKRTEAAITLSSNYPDYEILEPAREIQAEIIRPRKKLNLIVAIFLAFFIPTVYIIIRVFLNDKIGGINDIQLLAQRSVFGVIYLSSKNSEAVVNESPGSAAAESFRNLRSSLFLKLNTDNPKVILITSAQPQDGKSFISYNLACSIAAVGHKTVLIDCDLRRPVLHEKFSIENSKGLSNFMTHMSKEAEIIQATTIENLYFIPAGPILPNPSELIGSGILDALIESLKEYFTYIIIDTPPIGLVADSIQLMKYSSQILLVAKIESTKKEVFANSIQTLKNNKIGNFDIVLNGIDIEHSPYSSFKGYYHKH